MEFGIIEIGSTNTKAYVYSGGKLKDFGQRYIAFKNNYDDGLAKEDVETLSEFIREIQRSVKKVYTFGTSIFRKISEEERKEFADVLQEQFGVEFKVVSAEEEALYTVEGVVGGIDYGGKLAVVIGGGGSTEVVITEGERVIEKRLLDFGAMDVTKEFPDLKEDKPKTDFDLILSATLNKIDDFETDVDVLVLAGGGYIYFYEKAGYKMDANFLYDDENQPYLLTFEKLDFYDHDIMKRSLDEIKALYEDGEAWWNGARGMRVCMNAVARKLKAEYIVPTRINMAIGLASEILRRDGNER